MLKAFVTAVLLMFLTSQAQALTKTYHWRGPYEWSAARLLWCDRDFPVCGGPVADRFCQRLGYAAASDFARDYSAESLAGEPYLAGDPHTTGVRLYRSSCHDDRCLTFSYVTCESQERVRRGWHPMRYHHYRHYHRVHHMRHHKHHH